MGYFQLGHKWHICVFLCVCLSLSVFLRVCLSLSVFLCVCLSLWSVVWLCCHCYVVWVRLSFFLFHFLFFFLSRPPRVCAVCLCLVPMRGRTLLLCGSVDITWKSPEFKMQGHSSRIRAGELGQMMICSGEWWLVVGGDGRTRPFLIIILIIIQIIENNVWIKLEQMMEQMMSVVRGDTHIITSITCASKNVWNEKYVKQKICETNNMWNK